MMDALLRGARKVTHLVADQVFPPDSSRPESVEAHATNDGRQPTVQVVDSFGVRR
jgi:hypothetical protein